MADTPTNRLLFKLRQQRDDLDTTIRVIEAQAGGRASTNGHQILDVAEAALAAHGKRGPYKKQKPKRRMKHWTVGKARPLPDVKVPSGLSLDGIEVRDAIPLALKAYKRPASTMELTALLVAGGWKAPASAGQMPITRYVGMQAGNMARTRALGIKRTAKGWTTR